MKDGLTKVVGNFETAADAAAAIRTVKEAGLAPAMVFSPVNDHEIGGAMGRPTFALGWFSVVGAIAGGAAGLSLTIGTALQQPIMTGGQPIVSLPPFLVIIFELTILFGVLSTMVGMIWSIYRGRDAAVSYDERFSADRIGVVIDCGVEDVQRVCDLLSNAGAKELRDEKF